MSGKGLIRCSAPTDCGTCARRLAPGERCPEHPTVYVPPDGSEPQPLEAKPCGCSRPIAFADDFEVRCVRCGHTVEPAPKRRREGPSKPPEQKQAGDPSPPFLPGDQLSLL